MKRAKPALAAILICVLLGTSSAAVPAAEEDKTIEDLKAENAELLERIETLELENRELKDQIGKLQNAGTGEAAEAETEEAETEVAEAEETEAAEAETAVSGKESSVYTDEAIVTAVQMALNDAGYDCGEADGKAGVRTAAAVIAFKQENGLHVNGDITADLLAALGIQDDSAEVPEDESAGESADEDTDPAEIEAVMKEYPAYEYAQIAGKPSGYEGEKMRFRGKVLQAGDGGSGLRYIRLAVDSDYETVLFVSYPSDITDREIAEDDLVTVYGVCRGEYTYETVMDTFIALPWVEADRIYMSDTTM